MSYKKPRLIIFSAALLFFMAALFLVTIIVIMRFSDPLLSASPPPTNFLFFMIGLCILLFGSLIASGVGLLKRRKWARISSIVLLLLMMLSVLASFQNTPSEAATASASYRLGEAIGQFLTWGSFGLSLYALTLNKAVKRYFDHNEEANHS
jgi:hypothetical protein